MRRDALLRRVKETVRSIEASAEVVLYGSRARRRARADSDWDFLVLIDGWADQAITRTIRYALYDIELETGQVLSCIVRSRQDWDSGLLAKTPFRENVTREGVPI